MPVEFVHNASNAKDAYKLQMAYDGSGRRVSKTRYAKHDQFGYWTRNVVTHYTGIGTEVRESYFGGAMNNAKVVVKSLQGESRKNKLACSYDRTAAADAKGVHMPQGLGRYQPEDAVDGFNGVGANQRAGYRPPAKFEWYLKNHQGESSENVLVHFHCRAAECCALRHNHLGSTMLVYCTSAYDDTYFSSYKGGVKAAYDYRAFGEQVTLSEPTDKVTENFTGKEKDDETELNYFGARYLDPMLGMWTSVEPARQFSSPYLYMGNGTNPVILTDTDGNVVPLVAVGFTVVKGALVGVGAGMAFDFAKSRCKGDDFNYTVGDALVDGSFGIAAAVTKTGVTDLLGTIVAEKVGKEAVVKGAKFGVSKVLKKLVEDNPVSESLDATILDQSSLDKLNDMATSNAVSMGKEMLQNPEDFAD